MLISILGLKNNLLAIYPTLLFLSIISIYLSNIYKIVKTPKHHKIRDCLGNEIMLNFPKMDS